MSDDSLMHEDLAATPQPGERGLKEEATEVAQAATDTVKDVSNVARSETESVVGEARDQLRDLYAQSKTELTHEAAKQQDRIAQGLQSMGDDLGSMAQNTEQDGLARNIVREASQQADRIASWLADREPGDILLEVKAFARRKPGVFIGAAAIAGVLAGRLTRALASSDDGAGGAGGASRGERGVPVAPPAGSVGEPPPAVSVGVGAGVAGAGAHGAALPGTVESPFRSAGSEGDTHERPDSV